MQERIFSRPAYIEALTPSEKNASLIAKLAQNVHLSIRYFSFDELLNMSEISTKPYLLRAIYEWCTDNGFTPYLSVKVTAGDAKVPMEFVRKGEIVLNVELHRDKWLEDGQ